MRLIDFIVFYTMALYKKKKMDGLLWSNSLRRSVFIAGLFTTLCLYSLTEIIAFLVTRINFIDKSISQIAFIVAVLLIIQLFRYIYVRKERYEFIISSEYKAFTFSTRTGMTLVFLLVIFSFLLPIALTLLIYFYGDNIRL